MTYDPSKQYRCTIIRGKAKSDLDNLLPSYARIISEITPIDAANFKQQFNDSLNRLLGGAEKKTLDNHRTEIAHKLFGLFYTDSEGVVHISERASFFLENNDQPQFFKDICFKFQQPNGMDSIKTTTTKMKDGIKIRPFAYVLALLRTAQKKNIILSRREIAYYVLNSLEVLQGKVSPDVVLEKIIDDRSSKIIKEVYLEGKASSYNMQHIKEQLYLLEVSNLIIMNASMDIVLNEKEDEAIDLFIKSLDSELSFPAYKYDLDSVEGRKNFQREWVLYFSSLTPEVQTTFQTSVDALGLPGVFTGSSASTKKSTMELGNEGELYVYEYEKKKVSEFNKRLVNKVKWVATQRGIGYDIQSIVAEPGEFAEFAKYIEVKSTKRVTTPRLNDEKWEDSIGLTRNEYVASQQHRSSYYIYRVYFARDAINVFVIQDPYQKSQDHLLYLKPTQYRLEFSAKSVDNNF